MMKPRLATFFLALLMANVLNCSAGSSPKNLIQNEPNTRSREARGASECDEWQRTFNLLSDEGKETLRVHNIAINGNDPNSTSGYFVLSSTLVGDCRLRVQIGRFLYAAMEGTDNENDRYFANENSQTIIAVLRNVWNSGELSHEKDLILVNKGIRNEDISPFISELVEKRGFDSGITYTLIARPMATLEPAILKVRKRAEDSNDLPQLIYSLIALQHVAPKEVYLAKLKSVAHDRRLSAKTKRELRAIIQKFVTGTRLTFDEIEALGLPLLDELSYSGPHAFRQMNKHRLTSEVL